MMRLALFLAFTGCASAPVATPRRADGCPKAVVGADALRLATETRHTREEWCVRLVDGRERVRLVVVNGVVVPVVVRGRR